MCAQCSFPHIMFGFCLWACFAHSMFALFVFGVVHFRCDDLSDTHVLVIVCVDCVSLMYCCDVCVYVSWVQACVWMCIALCVECQAYAFAGVV